MKSKLLRIVMYVTPMILLAIPFIGSVGAMCQAEGLNGIYYSTVNGYCGIAPVQFSSLQFLQIMWQILGLVWP